MPEAVKAVNTASSPCRVPVKKSTLVRAAFRTSCRVTRIAFVDVEERLVVDVVRKQLCRDGEAADGRADRGCPGHLDRVLIGKRPESGRRPRHLAAVGEQSQAGDEQRREGRRVPRQERRVGQAVRRFDLQLVRGVGIVNRDAAPEAVGVDVHVDETERRRVCRRPRRGQRAHDQDEDGEKAPRADGHRRILARLLAAAQAYDGCPCRPA